MLERLLLCLITQENCENPSFVFASSLLPASVIPTRTTEGKGRLKKKKQKPEQEVRINSTVPGNLAIACKEGNYKRKEKEQKKTTQMQ